MNKHIYTAHSEDTEQQDMVKEKKGTVTRLDMMGEEKTVPLNCTHAHYKTNIPANGIGIIELTGRSNLNDDR